MEKITRKDILEYALKIHEKRIGVCSCLCIAIFHIAKLLVHAEDLELIFPKFKRRYALRFGARLLTKYWWRPYIWKKRLRFLEWLYEQYKEDDEDITETLKSL